MKAEVRRRPYFAEASQGYGGFRYAQDEGGRMKDESGRPVLSGAEGMNPEGLS